MLALAPPSAFPYTRAHPERPDAIRNEHLRVTDGDIGRAERLLATLGSPGDLLWPTGRWPAMELDHGLANGSAGGHGSVRYRVITSRQRSVVFEMARDSQLEGCHELACRPVGEHEVLWTHRLDLAPTLPAPVMRVVLALHDGILEDLLDNAEARMAGREPTPRRLSPALRLTRRVYLAGERIAAQRAHRP